jgi:chromosome segregation ATPase
MSVMAPDENTHESLRDFDERISGAIAAAKVLGRIKSDAEGILNEIQGIARNGEQSLQKADSARLQFQKLHAEWLKGQEQLNQVLSESKEIRESLSSTMTAAADSLGSKLQEAEERLTLATRASLSEQRHLLQQLESATRANADTVSRAQVTVTQTDHRLSSLLASLREDLQTEVRTKLAAPEGMLASELHRLEARLAEEQSALRTSLESQMADFFKHQNSLVTNLARQIDSLKQTSREHAEELATTHRRLTDVTAASAEATAQVAAIQEKLKSHWNAITAARHSIRETTSHLDETLDKLQRLPMFGRKFR